MTIPILDIKQLEFEEHTNEENVIAMMIVEEQEIYFIWEESTTNERTSKDNSIIL